MTIKKTTDDLHMVRRMPKPQPMPEGDGLMKPHEFNQEVSRLKDFLEVRIKDLSEDTGAFSEYRAILIGLSDLKALRDILLEVSMGNPAEKE